MDKSVSHYIRVEDVHNYLVLIIKYLCFICMAFTVNKSPYRYVLLRLTYTFFVFVT